MSYMSELHQSYHTVRERLYNPPKPNGHAPELVPLHPPAQYNDDRISGLLARIEDLNGRLRKAEQQIQNLEDRQNQKLKEQMSLQMAAAEMPEYAPRVPMNAIIRLVCETEHISNIDLKSMRRDKYAATARLQLYYLARQLTPLSYPQIARFVGMRDHTTIMMGARKVAKLRMTDPLLDEHLAWYELTLREQAAKKERSHQEQVPVAPKGG